jgi:hypothetical protein
MVRLLETAEILGISPGKSVALMAEKFAFEQSCENRGTVSTNKITIASRTELMNSLGDQFIPGASFAENEHRRIGDGHRFYLLKRTLQAWAFADDFHGMLCVLCSKCPQIGGVHFRCYNSLPLHRACDVRHYVLNSFPV